MIKFGPAGNSDLFYEQGFKSSLDAPKWLKNRNLDAYEYSFSRGFTVSEFVAKSLGEKCKDNNIEISVHAPYYINLANPDDEFVEKSYDYILKSLHYLKLMQGNRCVFHPGTCGKLSREESFELLKKRMKELVKRIDESGIMTENMLLCPETMGKSQQLGTYQEIAEICTYADYLVPTLDFGHINSLLQGKLKTEKDFEEIIKYLIDKLGISKVKKVHIHFSKIMYGAKGEIKHLTLEDTEYGPEFEPLAKVLKKYDINPVIICESRGCQAEDANILKDIYNNTNV